MEKMHTNYADIPPECLLRIIAFLTLADVAVLLQTSRLWHLVISDNENVIYRHLAATCESMDVPSESLDATLKGWVSVEASKVQSWKQYCRLQTFTAKRWRGLKSAYLLCDVFGASQQMEVHRIKVDTEKSLLVMSGGEVDTVLASNSALVVHCLRNPHQPAVFRLGQVSEYAHVEMSNGFIVLTCEESTALEVWRWAQDQDTEPLDRQPTERQISMYERAMEQAAFSPGSPHRGELVPMGMIRNPADSRATRLVYPTLCVGSRAGDSLWLWDIRARCLTQTINIEPSPYANSGFAMLYVDVNETHVFVATHTVSVYSRETGQCVFQLTKQHLALLLNSVHLPDQQMPTSHPAHGTFELSSLPGYCIPNKRQVQVAFQQIQDIVLAVHVSPSGDDFVALTARGCLFHVSGLKSNALHELAASGGGTSEPTTSSSTPSQPPDNSNTNSPSLEKFRISAARIDRGLGNLAYDGNRILAFGTYGLCILHIIPQPNNTFESTIGEGPTLKLHPFPVGNVARVFPFGHPGRTYLECSCLQMTQDSLWVAWEPTASVIDDFDMPYVKVVGMMDFAQPSNSQLQAPRPASV